MTTINQLKQELIAFLDVAPGETDISINDSLLERGLLDSMNVLELVAHLEKLYEVEFSSEDLTHKNFETIRTIGKLLAEKNVTIEYDNADYS